MSIISRMSIQGVRSFGTEPGDEQLVKFDSPLTLILGENGCGKTTIIECVKYALTGELPPGSDKGINFGHNPKINKSAITQGQVKMKLIDPITSRTLVITRSFQLTQEQKKMSFKSKDSAIHWEDKNGQSGSISGRCVDINAEMIATMGVSKPILTDVLFCHQEESYWPLDEGKKLKEKFDAIFDATKYNKCMDLLLKLRKAKESSAKDAEKDVLHFKYIKDETTSKRALLKETENKYRKCTENIVKFQEDLIPIEDRLKQISEVENNIIALKTEQKSLEINLTNCIQQQKELRNNIKEIYEGDVESLHQKIDQFQRSLSTKNMNLESAKLSLNKLEEKENECAKKITHAEVQKGELISMRSQEQELLASRNTKLNAMANDLDAEVEEIDDIKENVSNTIDSVRHKITQIHREIDHLSSTFDREDNKQQEILNKLRENQITLENEIKSKSSQMNAIEDEADNIQKQLDEIDKSATKLKELDTKIQAVNKEQQKLSEQSNIEALKKQVIDKIENRKSLEINLDKIEKELFELQKQSGIRAKLDVGNQQLTDKNNEVKKIKNKHMNELKTLFGTAIPSFNFKLAVQKKYEDFHNEVQNLNNLIKKKEHEGVSLKANREHQKEKIKSLTHELNISEEQIYEECNGQDYDSEISKLNDTIQKNLKHRGTLSSSSFIYERYIETFESEDPCCPLCHRNFENQEDVTELSSELKVKLRKLPAEIEKAEIALKRDQKKYDTLLSLKPINEKIASIKKELPVLNDKLKKTEISLQTVSSEVENFKLSICEPESNMQLANSLIPDMSFLDQGLVAIQKLQNEVKSLQSKLPEEQSGWTLEDAQSEQSVVKVELQQLRNDIEQLQSKITKQTDKLNDVREKKNKLIEEKLRLESGVQARSQLAASYEKSQEQLAVLSVEIEKCKCDQQPLQRQYDESLKQKNLNFERNRAILKEKNIFVTNLEKKFDDIQKDTEKLHQFSKQNLSIKVEEILRSVQDLYEKRDELANMKRKVQLEINQLKDYLSNQQLKERELIDNLTLRQKQAEEANLEQKKRNLLIKMGNMNSKNILIEKSCGSEDEVLPSVASLRRLFHQRLPMWRAEVLAAVEKDAVQHKGLEHSSVTYLQSSLAKLVCQLRDEFPGWCEHSEEVKIVSLMEEVCRRISDSGEGSSGDGNKYCSLPGLGHHLAQSRQLSSRLSSVLAADGASKDGGSGSLRTITTRRHRGDGGVVVNGSATNALPPPAVTVACRPLLEQLKDLLDTAISRDLHIFTQAKSALLELAEVVEVLHLTELTVRSSLSSVKRIVDSLSSLGVYNVGEEQGERNLANLVDEIGLTRCLTACLAAPTASDHQRHHPRGAQTRAVAEVDEAEVASATARLIFAWCVQVNKHCLPLKGASTCPENRQAWLSYLSDLLVIEKFIFGNCNIEGGNSSSAIPSELMRCRRDLDAYSDFHLSSFRNLASRFLDKIESVLPVDLFSNFLEAVVASPIENDTLTQLHQAAFKQDVETFERLLKTCSDAMDIKIRAALTNATTSSLCPVCRERLGLTEVNIESVDDCPLCPFLLARQANTTVASPDLKKGMKLGLSDLSGQASGILSCAVTKCALFVENRHYSWLRQVDSVLLQNSEVFSQFLSRQPKTFIDGLPDSLKNTASMLCTQNAKNMSSTASFQSDLLVLIVEGQALPAVTVASPTILQLLRGLLVL